MSEDQRVGAGELPICREAFKVSGPSREPFVGDADGRVATRGQQTQRSCRLKSESFRLVRMRAKDELVVLLQKCAEILRSVRSKKMKNALNQLEELLCRFQQLDGTWIKTSNHIFRPEYLPITKLTHFSN